jgi:hypothetical protein
LAILDRFRAVEVESLSRKRPSLIVAPEEPLAENRNTGPRDIKDLKARLGLKPTAAAPAAQAGPQMGVPAPVPPPPGFGPPPGAAPAPPAPPDLTRDPFAVQMAAAPVAPPKVDFEIPKEWTQEAGAAVKEKSAIAPILIYVAIALVPLIVGYACGRINGGRADVNLTIEHAKKIKKEVDGIAAINQKIEDAFDASMARAAKGGPVPDMDLVNEIKGLNLTAPATDTIFRSNYFHMKDLAIERLFNYYNSTIQLYNVANVHARRSESDKELLERYAKQAKANAASAEQTFGVTIDPSGPIPVGKLVMVGEVICKKEFKEQCPQPKQWDGFWVKSDNTSSPVKRMLYTTKDNERVIPLDKTPLFQKVIVGSPEALAAEAYGRRLKEMKELIEKLKPARKDLLKELEDQANKSKIFAL